jgi:hypothetical protein
MKKIFLASLTMIALMANAQNEKFTQAMQKNLESFGAAKTVAELEKAAAAFTRIGDAEKNQWLPYYWAGLALSRIGWIDEKTDKDALAIRILALCDKAEALTTSDGDKSEILSVRNMAVTQQMLVDPQNRWMTHGQQAAGYLKKAMQLHPSNPRPYYLQAMSVFNTPEQFGGGKSKAKPLFEKAVELYKAESTKALHPHWGLEESQQMLAQCQ